MKLYTKTGDKGYTGLIGGSRVPKNDVRVEAYGTVDELNSFIGLLNSFEIPENEKCFLLNIQNQLFNIGSVLATDTQITKVKHTLFNWKTEITKIESEIDRLDAMLPELNAFVLPGGSQTGALCHVCRTVSRRAERRIIDVLSIQCVDNDMLVYFNRLSDYFFVLSRYLTHETQSEEIFWKR